MAYMGKFKRFHAVVDSSEAWKTSRFMLSPAGHYNGHIYAAVLSALDHANDYPEGHEKREFWITVSKMLDNERRN